jgi:beta-lactamase superfamily II metal-dependent hydrolase
VQQDPSFIEATDARLAIASAGADNDYGHPGAAHAAACAIAGDDRIQDR